MTMPRLRMALAGATSRSAEVIDPLGAPLTASGTAGTEDTPPGARTVNKVPGDPAAALASGTSRSAEAADLLNGDLPIPGDVPVPPKPTTAKLRKDNMLKRVQGNLILIEKINKLMLV